MRPQIKEILQAPDGIDRDKLKAIAKGEAESRWKMLSASIEQLRKSQTSKTPTSTGFSQRFSSIQNGSERNPVELFDLWKSADDDQKRALFSFLPKLCQIAVCGQIFLENQALGDSLWEQFPMDERVVYYVLLSPVAQKTCHPLLPVAVQQKLSPESGPTNP